MQDRLTFLPSFLGCFIIYSTSVCWMASLYYCVTVKIVTKSGLALKELGTKKKKSNEEEKWQSSVLHARWAQSRATWLVLGKSGKASQRKWQLSREQKVAEGQERKNSSLLYAEVRAYRKTWAGWEVSPSGNCRGGWAWSSRAAGLKLVSEPFYPLQSFWGSQGAFVCQYLTRN